MISFDRTCAKPMIRLGVGVAIPSLLDGFGINPRPFLQRRGLDIALFNDANSPISYATLANLASDAAEATGCDHFGLLVGSAADLGTLGAIGAEAAHAPDARAALRLIISQFDSHNRGAILALDETDEAHLSYSVIDRDVLSGETIIDGAMAVAMRIMGRLCGQHFRPSAVQLPRRAPKEKGPYERLFRCRVSFNMPMARMSFERAWLDCPLHRVEAPSGQHEDRLAPLTGADLIARVTVEVSRRLMSGLDLSADAVAHALGMSRRTLHRELSKELRTYHSVSNDVRFSYAKRLLHDTEMSLTEIAAELGYSELSSFTRAFARSFGVCPSVWREKGKAAATSSRSHGSALATPRQCEAPRGEFGANGQAKRPDSEPKSNTLDAASGAPAQGH